MSGFALGTKLLVEATFTDETGAPVDPTTVTARLRVEGQTERLFTYNVDPELTRASQGVYQLRYTPTSSGAWFVRFKGVGAVEAASLDTLIPVQPTRLTP